MPVKKIIQFLFKSPWEDNREDGAFDNKVNDFYKKMKSFKLNPNNSYTAYFYLLLVAFALWLSSGIYIVKEGEEALVIRFGKYVAKTTPGLNYHLPYPLEEVIIERVNKSRRIEIGYRSNLVDKGYSKMDSRNNTNRDFVLRDSAGKKPLSESIMLTGDENIVDLSCDVMWSIKNLEDFTFSVFNPEETVRAVSESVIRDVISQVPIIGVLSNQKQQISAQVEEMIQKILDQYQLGINLEKVELLTVEPPVEVIDSYRDVQTARADKEREINQAYSYSNDVLPKARGDAIKILQEAEAYKQETVAKAEGETKRFLALLPEFERNRDLMIHRLHYDTAEYILKKNANKIVMNNNNLLPHLPIVNK